MGKQCKQWQTILGDSKITADGDCSHEIKRRLLLGRKVMTNLNSLLKNRDITLPTNVHLVKAMVFPVVMYGCESWTIKQAERQRIDGFWAVVLEETLESLLDWREFQSIHSKGDQCWIFIGRPDAEAETSVLWPPVAMNWLIWKDPDVGKNWRWEKWMTGWDGWMASPTQWEWVWVNSRRWWWAERPGVLVWWVAKSRMRLIDWTELISSLRAPDHSLLLTEPGLLINLPRNWLSH